MSYFAAPDAFRYNNISIQKVDDSFYINGVLVPISYIERVVVSPEGYLFFEPLVINLIFTLSDDDLNEFDLVFKFPIGSDENINRNDILTSIINVFANAGLSVYFRYQTKVKVNDDVELEQDDR